MALDARLAAAQALAAVLGRGQSLNQSLPSLLDRVPERDRGLVQELCYGTLRWQPRLQLLVSHLMSKALKTRDADVQALLLIGLYQLVYTRMPDHAALSSCVAASKKLRKPWASGLINGVLRSFQRQREELETELAQQPCFRFGHPQWLIEQMQRAWPAHWQTVLEQNNLPPPMTLRVNARRTTRDIYLQHLRDNEFPCTPTLFSADGLTLQTPQDPRALPGFAEGLCSVQDEAAQLAAGLLQLAPGQRVLDACCAPGGKLCHILEQEADLLVSGVDSDPSRLERVGENLERLQLNATLIPGDAGDIEHWWNGESFDRILLDAPCSGTGVIRRHPDIKLLRRPSDIAKLAKLQAHLLRRLWQTLKPGGLLVYATCSVLPAENEQQVAAFVRATEDAVDQPIAAAWGEARPFGRQLLPQPNGHDGFYYAVLAKKPV